MNRPQPQQVHNQPHPAPHEGGGGGPERHH
jgi:hypothetical protein